MARLVQEEISEVEKDPGFCTEAEIEKLQKELDSVISVLSKLQPLNQGKVNYECR